MTAFAPAWFEDDDPRELRRWAIAAAVVVAVHIAAIAAYVYGNRADEIGEDSAPIAVDFTPGDDTVDQTEVAPVPDEQQKQIEQQPPDTSQAVVATPEVQPQQQVEPPPTPAMPMRNMGRAPLVASSYQTAVVQHLGRHRPPYPSGAQERQEEGTIHLSFDIDRNGHVLERHIVKGSGYADLDRAALAMIDKAQPFPPFPSSMAQPDETFDFMLNFTAH
jgi:periplasmic protein TonB